MSFHAHHPTRFTGESLLAGMDGADVTLLSNSSPLANAGLFVGIRQAPSLPWRMLPLFAKVSPEAVERFEILTPGRYGRTFALASDRWLIGPLVFKLCTPWWATSSPGESTRETARLNFSPSIGGFVEYDNTHCEAPVEVMVGMGAPAMVFRRASGAIAGFVSEGGFGFAASQSTEIRCRLGSSPFSEDATESGNHAALVFTVPAFTKRVHPFAVGFHDADASTPAGAFFRDVPDVLVSALANNAEVVRRADELDAGWFTTPGTRDEKVARALAVREQLAGSRIARGPSGWTLVRPMKDGLEAFDAEFFPWAGENQTTL